MACKPSTAIALLLLLNLLFFSLTSACYGSCPTPKHKHRPRHRHKHKHKPPPCHKYYPPPRGKCPMDTLKLGVCADVLHGLLGAKIGKLPKVPCCPLIEGLVDLEAALCLCTAIKANVLGIVLDLPLSVSLLLNYCGKKVPAGFQCP